ncbi:hypothetical protein IAT38_003873 [Cryptococcus sp. DSM 104549]
MSRGGFRGGRGGGRGGMPAGVGFGQISQTEWKEGMDKIKQDAARKSASLYPPLEHNQVAYLPAPSEQESLIMANAITLQKTLSTGKLPPGEQSEQLVEPGQEPPWRIAGERKVVGIEIELYDSKKRPSKAAGPSKLDPVALRMDPAMFPPSLWAEYFEGVEGGNKAKPRKKRRLEDLDKEDGKDEEESAASSAEEDFDFDDDESDHQDYDANYFDNGEGDDDEGGDEEGGDAYED